jgi:hypothetical protein
LLCSSSLISALYSLLSALTSALCSLLSTICSLLSALYSLLSALTCSLLSCSPVIFRPTFFPLPFWMGNTTSYSCLYDSPLLLYASLGSLLSALCALFPHRSFWTPTSLCIYIGMPDPMFDAASMLAALEKELRSGLTLAIAGLVAIARTRLEDAFAEVAKERAKGLAAVDARRQELHSEREAMRKHKVAQEGRIELNIGGYRHHVTVQALRRVPHTFFDAYFSGRYAQDVCDDGSIFVDRDGEHFGHVLEYMCDGHVSVAEPDARPSISLLRALKCEFGFYCFGCTRSRSQRSGKWHM